MEYITWFFKLHGRKLASAASILLANKFIDNDIERVAIPFETWSFLCEILRSRRSQAYLDFFLRRSHLAVSVCRTCINTGCL